MSTFDNLNAPQFSTFDDSDPDVETYFEVDHESKYFSPAESPAVLKLRNRQVRRRSVGDDEIPGRGIVVNKLETLKISEEETVKSNGETCKFNEEDTSKLSGESMDVPVGSGSVAEIVHKWERAASSDSLLVKEETEVSNKKTFKFGQLTKTKSTSAVRLKYCSQESLNRLAAPKTLHSSTGSIPKSSNEYVSVAEAVKKFQEKTPTRFHSRNQKLDGLKNPVFTKLKATIPHSPKLLTKTRVKTTSHVLSQEEREKLEFEEAQKFRVKANPVNKKIFRQPMKAIHFDKKPSTVPEPFDLTKVEPKKHLPSPKKSEYQFHAKPVPKSVLEPKKIAPKVTGKITEPVTPSFVRSISKPSPVKKPVERIPSSPLKKTTPVPFSFEQRDKKIHEKKEELKKQALEEEKRAREFHARPIPKPIVSLINKQKSKALDGSSSSLGTSQRSNGDTTRRSSEDIQGDVFKARPPVVLYQKPFVPKKVEHPLTELQPFDLNSEERARRRAEFERKKREIEEEAQRILKIEEEERLRREQEEIKKLRKEADFKAKPVRNYKETVIKPSGKVTEPVSPTFRSGKKNKENFAN